MFLDGRSGVVSLALESQPVHRPQWHSPVALAGVLAFATVVAGLASSLALTLILAFACVFTLFSIRHRLQGDACMARAARCIDTHGEGPVRRPATPAPAITALDG
jgi:hypothetical protein